MPELLGLLGLLGLSGLLGFRVRRGRILKGLGNPSGSERFGETLSPRPTIPLVAAPVGMDPYSRPYSFRNNCSFHAPLNPKPQTRGRNMVQTPSCLFSLAISLLPAWRGQTPGGSVLPGLFGGLVKVLRSKVVRGYWGSSQV